MNGTPRGRTSRLKQRRTESRQEKNFFQNISILLTRPCSWWSALSIERLWLGCIFCWLREEEEVGRRRGESTTRLERRRQKLSLLLRLNLSNQVPIFALVWRWRHCKWNIGLYDEGMLAVTVQMVITGGKLKLSPRSKLTPRSLLARDRVNFILLNIITEPWEKKQCLYSQKEPL